MHSIGKFGLSFEMDISEFAIKHEIRHKAGGFQLRNPIPDFFFTKSEIRNCKTFLLNSGNHEVLVFEISIRFSCINVNPKSGFLNLNPDVLVESTLYYCTIVIGWFYSEICSTYSKIRAKA